MVFKIFIKKFRDTTYRGTGIASDAVSGNQSGITTANAFQNIPGNSGHNPHRIWADKGSELWNKSIKSCLQDNTIKFYSTHNKEKSVVAKRCIKILKNEIYKHLREVSKNKYTDKLGNNVDEYNNKYHGTIKMKSIDVKASTYIDFDVENNNKNPKFKVGYQVRISKCKNIFAKVYTPDRSKEICVIKKVKNAVPWTYIIEDWGNYWYFYETDLQKTMQKSLG